MGGHIAHERSLIAQRRTVFELDIRTLSCDSKVEGFGHGGDRRNIVFGEFPGIASTATVSGTQCDAYLTGML
jgi:hypothetical protein